MVSCIISIESFYQYINRKGVEKMIEQIKTNDSRFLEIEGRFKQEINDFISYSHKRSELTGNVNVSSNKASSYKNHLIRLILHYERIYGDLFHSFTSYESFVKLNNIKNHKGFKEFNRKKSNFYSAALGEYERYILEFQGAVEIEREQNLNQEIQNYETQESNKDLLIKKPVIKEDMTLYNLKKRRKRSINEALYAKEKAGWECELNRNHRTFINRKGRQFVEVHHLIPLVFQADFNYSIDFADNLVALCPNCHRMVHYGQPESVIPALEKTYFEREEKYPIYGIKLTFDHLLNYYLERSM